MWSFLQRSFAVPLEAPRVDCSHSPGVRLKLVAAILPTFLMVTVVMLAAPPGVRSVPVPPYLLIEAQVAALPERPLGPSVLRHGLLVPAEDSSMMRVPVPAVLALLVIEALKAENVGDIPSASTSDETLPARTSGRESLRFFEEVSDIVMVTASSSESSATEVPRLGDAPG